MGFFETLGRKVGEVTHEAKQTAAEQTTHVCADCGEQFYTPQETCPECGADAIVEREVAASNRDESEGEVAETDEQQVSEASNGDNGDSESAKNPDGPVDAGEPAALIEDAESDRTDDAQRNGSNQ